MNLYSSAKYATCLLIVSFIFVLILYSVVATGQVLNPDEVKILYSTPISVSLGEPIVIDFTISNGSKEAIECTLGFRRKNAFRLSVFEFGKWTRLEPLWEEGLSGPNSETVKPGGNATAKLVLNEWHEIDRPGKYLININLPTPITAANGAVLKVKSEAVLTVEVTSADRAAMGRRIQQLQKEMGCDSAECLYRQMSAAEALRYIKDPTVIPTAEWVCTRYPVFSGDMIWALSRVGTDEAVKVILSVARKNMMPSSLYAIDTLKRMLAGIKNDELKSQIESVIRK